VKTADKLLPGESGIVKNIEGEGALRRRIIDMGVTPGTKIIMKRLAPLGDPIEFEVRSYNLSIRISEARQINLE
jgi:Fe2+ transport system protein FeoA